MEPSNLGASPASDQPAETFERQFQKMDIGSSQCGTISALTQELEAQKLGSELQIGAASAEEQVRTASHSYDTGRLVPTYALSHSQ